MHKLHRERHMSRFCMVHVELSTTTNVDELLVANMTTTGNTHIQSVAALTLFHGDDNFMGKMEIL